MCLCYILGKIEVHFIKELDVDLSENFPTYIGIFDKIVILTWSEEQNFQWSRFLFNILHLYYLTYNLNCFRMYSMPNENMY
jgi:hypothetical protein